jgi:hypothetical protein
MAPASFEAMVVFGAKARLGPHRHELRRCGSRTCVHFADEAI